MNLRFGNSFYYALLTMEIAVIVSCASNYLRYLWIALLIENLLKVFQ